MQQVAKQCGEPPAGWSPRFSPHQQWIEGWGLWRAGARVAPDGAAAEVEGLGPELVQRLAAADRGPRGHVHALWRMVSKPEIQSQRLRQPSTAEGLLTRSSSSTSIETPCPFLPCKSSRIAADRPNQLRIPV